MAVGSILPMFPQGIPQAQATSIGRAVYAWGEGTSGQQGNGGTANILEPTGVPQLSALHAERGIQRLYSGIQHNIAIMADGTVWTWGRGDFGQLGNGGTSDVLVPTEVSALTALHATRGIEEIHTGQHHNIAIMADDTVWVWGHGAFGQLGNGGTANVLTPTQVPALTTLVQTRGIEKFRNGTAHNFILTSDGAVFGWGQGTHGRLGRNSTADALAPTQIAQLTTLHTNHGIERFYASGTHNMIITSGGAVFMWGNGAAGRLGNGGTANLLVPTQVAQPTTLNATRGIDRVYIGYMQTIVVTADDRVYGWGSNDRGQLGNGGSPTQVLVPTEIPQLTTLFANYNLTRAIKNQHVSSYLFVTDCNKAYGWGVGSDGRQGNGGEAHVLVPTEVPAISALVEAGAQFFMGGRFTFAFAPVEPVEGEFLLIKHLQKPEGTPSPNLNFRFTFERYSFNGESTPADIARIPVINPVIINPTTVVSPPPPPAGTVTLSGYADILDSIVFTERGVFSWIVREDATHPSGAGANSSVVFSQAEYELRVYVRQEAGIGGDLYILAVTLHRLTDPITGDDLVPPLKVDDLTFVNLYTRTTAANQHFEISKTITGQFADLSDTFTFEITLTRTALCPENRTFTGRVVNELGNPVSPPRTYTFTTGVTQNVVLGHNQRLIFDGANAITLGSTFLVVEQACPFHIASVRVYSYNTAQPPAPYYLVLSNTEPDQARTTNTHTIGANRNAALFTNTHQMSPPTGLFLTSGSLYLVVFTTGVAITAYLSLRARKRIEELPIMH